MADRTFLLKIVGDTTGAQKALGEVDKSVNSTRDNSINAFKAIGAAVTVGAVVAFGKSVVDAASNQEQAIGALNSVFKEYADNMNEFGQTTAENLGISRAEFSQLAAVTGSLLKNAGVPLNEVADSTKTLTERAADLAAMYGGTVPEAMEAMNSAFKGEFDPLEKYGVSLKAAAIEAKAVAMGLTDAEGKATDYGKTMAAQALILEQSADAQGTFARESGTVAGQTQRLKAQFTDLQADIGNKLLPVLVSLAEILREVVEFVTANQGWLIPLAGAIMGVVVAIKAWQLAQMAWTVATQAATAAQWLWNAAMMANPIGLIIAAIAAVIAIVVLLYTKVDWFRAGVDAAIDGIVAAFKWLWEKIQQVFNWMKDNWPLLLAIITGPFGAAVAVIVKNWDTIVEFFRGIPEKIGRVLAPVWDAITWPFRHAWESIKYVTEQIVNAFKWVVDSLKWLFGTVADIITYPFRKAFEAIKWLWNSTIGGFGFTVPSWIPIVGGKEFRIPKLASGGIVTRPTIALLGEAGPEAVVPLNRQGAGVGATYIVNVYALNANAETGRLVAESLREYNRSNGGIGIGTA